MKAIFIMTAFIFLLFITGCTTKVVPKQKPLLIGLGASAGALTGYAIGKNAIGTALGAVGGSIIGNYFQGSDPQDLQSAYNQGYLQARNDAIKRQYWLKQFNERGGEERGKLAYYSIPAGNMTQDGRELVDHNLVIPIIE